MVNEYPKEGKVTHPDDVGKRRMPERKTKVAGDVIYNTNLLSRVKPTAVIGNHGYEDSDPDAFAKAHREGKVKVLHPTPKEK